MKDAQQVTLAIYDVLGRKMYSENKGRLNAGLHNIKLNGNDLESGVYFLTLGTEKGVLTQKIVINK